MLFVALHTQALTTLKIGNNRFVSLSNFKGVLYVDIREFYEDKESGELKPGKKGMKTSLNIGEGKQQQMR